MKRKRSTSDCPSVGSSKRHQPTLDATRSTPPRTHDAQTPSPSPPASQPPVHLLLASDATHTTCTPPELLSPRTPVYHHCAPDPDFAARVWKAYDANMAKTNRSRKLRQLLREYKYGKDIAARYSPGTTPESVSNLYIRHQAELMRRYEEEESDMSEDGEWERRAVLKPAQRIPKTGERCLIAHLGSTPSSKRCCKCTPEQPAAHIETSEMVHLPTPEASVVRGDSSDLGEGDDGIGARNDRGRRKSCIEHGDCNTIDSIRDDHSGRCARTDLRSSTCTSREEATEEDGTMPTTEDTQDGKDQDRQAPDSKTESMEFSSCFPVEDREVPTMNG
ncbi:unnamed protein product [Zymoseptoria tritici ST99CH_1E4]|uniref:Uncharacterized protein n=1 Tax=Zymoseptoria tritici ST99CH_1E4 TaxID=1276532 RepID=A0A2H1H929_ZYMTR|nr:unnamed protein product [Zymoseptoria tritici ST99CH_1E4]